MDFVHLSLQSEYSLLNSFVKIDDLFLKLSELGFKAITLTDEAVLFGMMDFYKVAKKYNIKAIFGMKIRIISGNNKYWITLLIKDEKGYQNLLKLNALSYQNDVDEPYITFNNFLSHKESLVVLDGGISSKLYSLASQENVNQVVDYVNKMAMIFQKNYYVAISKDLDEDTNRVSALLEKLYQNSDIKLVAVNEIRYLNSEDCYYLKVLNCIKNNKAMEDKTVSIYDNGKFYLRPADEMLKLFADNPKAIQNTVEIAESCNFTFDFNSTHLPKFKDYKGENELKYFKRVCYQGMYQRYNIKSKFDDGYQKLTERLDREIETIKTMGYIDYFLIVADFIRYAKRNGIRVGAGRGSAGGSLTAYALGITDVDPIKYDLIFERFLNPERVTMPDIDIDFEHTKRQQVIDYVIQKYGRKKIANIATFGTFGVKAGIRDVARVLNVDLKLVGKVTGLISSRPDTTMEKALSSSAELRNLYLHDNKVKKIIDIAKAICGMPRHVSTHAAGVVITEDDVANLTPVYVQGETVLTQFNMTYIEQLGFLKMDFLGLISLGLISDTIKLIEESGDKIDKSSFEILFDNQKAYEIIGKGLTMGVFQLESTGMKKFLKNLRPKNLEDIVVGISLYRPGPMDSIPKFLKNREKKSYQGYGIKIVDEILSSTNGCLVYQEQVIEITRKLAGFTYAKADIIRRAMSKKKHTEIEKERKNFIEQSISNGASPASANKVFEDMLKFAEYAFNKSHAVGYATISYQTAYLKANFTSQFYSALFSNYDKKSSIDEYIKEMSHFGCRLLKPCVLRSSSTFSPAGSDVRYGLSGIKNVGKNPAKYIEERRKSYKFKSGSAGFIEFVTLLEQKFVNKKCMESLILAGAFDIFGLSRASMILNFDEVQRQNSKKSIYENQITLFDMENFDININNFKYINCAEYDKMYLANKEIELIGTCKCSSQKMLVIYKDSLNSEDRDFLQSLTPSKTGFKIRFIEKSGQKRDYKTKILINSVVLDKFYERYTKPNVSIEEVLWSE